MVPSDKLAGSETGRGETALNVTMGANWHRTRWEKAKWKRANWEVTDSEHFRWLVDNSPPLPPPTRTLHIFLLWTFPCSSHSFTLRLSSLTPPPHPPLPPFPIWCGSWLISGGRWEVGLGEVGLGESGKIGQVLDECVGINDAHVGHLVVGLHSS